MGCVEWGSCVNGGLVGRRGWVVGRGDWGLGSGGMWSGEWGGCRVGKWEWGVGEGWEVDREVCMEEGE